MDQGVLLKALSAGCVSISDLPARPSFEDVSADDDAAASTTWLYCDDGRLCSLGGRDGRWLVAASAVSDLTVTSTDDDAFRILSM